ncbi:MAG TPA: VOC family protein [Kofleriaceae bacterium]|jgi:2,3-dihydroxy-p-cumate/2,3-dihydroxybenzoate 3,4-dioxygenase
MRWLDDIRAVRLGAEDLDTSVAFATEILGLQLVRRDARRAYLRAGAGADHHVCYVKGGGLDAEALEFAVPHGTSLGAAADALAKTGYLVREGTKLECEERRVAEAVVLVDPTGNRIELVGGQETAPTWTPSRDAGITEFSHVGLRTTDAPRDERFWLGMGARVSDWIGETPLLRTDEIHHRIALFPSNRRGVQHVNFQVGGVDDVMRAYYFLRERGVPIVFGPGRHPTSSAMFCYFQGPDGIIYEYSAGVRLITDEASYEPRRFPKTASSFCMWGSKPDIEEFRAP